MLSSARNVFFGHVTQVLETPLLTEVSFQTQSSYELVSVITSESFERLALSKGEPVMAMIKAPGVLLGMEGPKDTLSARNCFPGTVTGIARNGAVAEVLGDLDDGTPMCALCTVASLDRLGIKESTKVWFFFKSLALILTAENRHHEDAAH